MSYHDRIEYFEKRKTTIDLYHLTVIELKILRDDMWQWVGVDNNLTLTVSINKKKNVKYEWYVHIELIMCGPPINGRSSPFIGWDDNYQMILKHYGEGLLINSCTRKINCF